MKSDKTYLLPDLIARRKTAFLNQDEITYCWDGDTAIRRDPTSGVMTLVTKVERLPQDGWHTLSQD